MKKIIITFLVILTLNLYGATSVSQALSYLRGQLDAMQVYDTTVITIESNTVVLSPNLVYYLNTTGGIYNVSITTNGLLNTRANMIAFQMDYTNTASVVWPASTIMQWQSGATPTLKAGRNFIYFDRLRTNDVWKGFIQ